MTRHQYSPREDKAVLRWRVAANLRAARVRAGLTQVELAEAIESDQPNVSRWERGGGIPRPMTLVRLALALGIEVANLFVPLDDESRVAA